MIITRTPLRIPLGGGGTDLPTYYSRYGGALLGAAIDKYVYITINRRFEESIRVSYSQTEIADSVDEIKHPLVREALKLLRLSHSLEIVSIADLPANTGLGSSSSFTVGLLHALHALKRESVGPQQLAEEAFHIEVERLGEPIGKQDQYMAAYGGVTALQIACSGTVAARHLPLPEDVMQQFESDVMLFYTGIKRGAGDVLVDQSQAVTRGDEEVAQSLHEIKAIGRQVEEALIDGDVTRFGALLHQHWLTKKRMSAKISSDHIDRWYDLALQHGATGGKLMGAGGGGFFMFHVRNGDKARLRKALAVEHLRETRFAIEREGSKVMLNV